MDSQKFFIALLPSPEVQISIHEIKVFFAENYDARKAFNSPPHITLQAPFEWSSELNLKELTDGLRHFAAGRERIAIALRNFGAFPPKVIYVDVVQNPDLMTLQKELTTFMANKYGIKDNHYANFCPHVTVAFRDLTEAAFHQAWSKFQSQKLEFTFAVQYLTLLQHNGRGWEAYQNYPFK